MRLVSSILSVVLILSFVFCGTFHVYADNATAEVDWETYDWENLDLTMNI